VPDRIPPAGPHGGDGRRLAAALGIAPADVVDLSASMHPYAPDVTSVVRAILDADADLIGAYPDAEPATRAVAHAVGVAPDRVVLTNGAAEAIALVARQVPVAAIVEPEFSLYRRHLRRIEPDAPRWRSDPGNPSGRLAPDGDRAAVRDEAFYPIATGRWTRGDDTAWRIGSLTKLWACPGLRIGFVVAPDPAAAAVVRDDQPRWSVNALAAAVIEPLLARTDLPAMHRALVASRARFGAAVRDAGFVVTETDANWVLVEHPDLRRALAPHAIAVRDCTSFGMPGIARVAVPRDDTLERVLAAFARIGPPPL
jgi:histidinol-phosphate/aromatic aminotransferase/cobyric acid decarboxylase-like protein